MADKFQYLYQDPDSGSQVTASTPNGIYDTDTDFQTESLGVCKFVSRRLAFSLSSGMDIFLCFSILFFPASIS